MPTSPDRSTRSQITPAGAATTLAEVLTRIEQDRQLPDARRKAFAGAIRTICSILSRPPDAAPGDMGEIERLLGGVPTPIRGRSRKTVANARSMLKAALLHCAGGAKMPPRGTPLSPEWADLERKLEDLRLKHGLSRLMRIASFHGIVPGEMSDEVLQQVVDVVRTVNWGRDTLPFQRKVVSLWNEAADSISGWPPVRLTPPATAARREHLPLAAFPLSFQQDVEAYLAWAAGSDPLAADAPAQRLKESTISLRRNQLRIAASTLAKQLDGPARVTNLAELVQPDHVKQVLTAFLQNSTQASSGAFVRGLAMTLKTVARHWVKATQADLDELARLQRRLGSQPTGLTPKNRAVIRQLEDPRLLGKLLALPDTLRTQAAAGRLALSRRLQKMQIALAIDLLLAAPMRLQNLATLQLDRQIQWPSGRDGTVFITLEEHETKNDQPLEYPLPDATRDALHDYLDRYRRKGTVDANSWLFVRPDGTLVPAATLRDGITKATKRELGVQVTPHQFRHLAAAITLDAQPGALGMVKDLLGHKSLKTAQNFYVGMRTRQAGLAYDKILARKRAVAAEAR